MTGKATKRSTKAAKATKAPAAAPRLLSGGNPQIAKGEGNAPVQAWIAAVPDGKRQLARRVDALIARAVPKVRKAVKWNSPLYGNGDGWFLGLHVYARYLKVTFFRGAALAPMPPGKSRQPHVRHLDLRYGEDFDEAQFVDWVAQASRLPGEKM
jgi:hypothetical protein